MKDVKAKKKYQENSKKKKKVTAAAVANRRWMTITVLVRHSADETQLGPK